MPVFGVVASLQSPQGTFIFIFFLILLVFLEAIVSAIEAAASRRGMKELFVKLQKELMMTGVISFIVYVFSNLKYSSFAEESAPSFEMTHIIILFMALAFVTQAVFLVSYATVSGKRYLAAMRTSSADLLTQYKSLQSHPYKWWWFHYSPSALPVYPSIRFDIEFRIVERLFIYQHKLPADFNFAHYVNDLFKVYTAELGDVSPFSWFLLACLVALNYLREVVVDPTAKHGPCSEHLPEVDDEVVLSEAKRAIARHVAACTTYVLIYAYTLAAVLSCATLVIYFASTVYLDRIVVRSLTVDRIGIKGRFAYKESLVIMIRRDKVAAHNVLDQSIVALTKRKPSHSQRGDMACLIAESKERELLRAHYSSFSSIYTMNAFKMKLLNLLKWRHKPAIRTIEEEESDLSNIFLFSSPFLFFKSVEAILLFQCFYISMVATQLIPLVKSSFHNASWVVGFLIPIGFNFLVIQMILNKTVLLRSVYQLNREVAGRVCEDVAEERLAVAHLRQKMAEKLREGDIADTERRAFLRAYFFRYDLKGTGIVRRNDFRLILGDLRIYMSRESFTLLWQAVDFDLSGGLDWDEIENLFFPAFKLNTDDNEEKNDLNNDVSVVSNSINTALSSFQEALQKLLLESYLAPSECDQYIQNICDELSKNEYNQMKIDGFERILKSMKITVNKSVLKELFAYLDINKNGQFDSIDFFGARCASPACSV